VVGPENELLGIVGSGHFICQILFRHSSEVILHCRRAIVIYIDSVTWALPGQTSRPT